MGDNDNTTTAGQVGKKFLDLEVMRIVAIFFVIFNHTGKDGSLLFISQPLGGGRFWLYMVLSVFCKFAVPLFFAISGALLLGREPEPLARLWRRRIAPMLIMLVGISALYYVAYMVVYGNVNFGIADFIESLCTNNIAAPLWFLYAYISYLIVLPFLQSMTKSLKYEHYYYFMAIAAVFNGIIPAIEYLATNGASLYNNMFNQYFMVANLLLYPCIGYFIQNKFEITVKKLIVSWGVNALTIAFTCFMTFCSYKNNGTLPELDMNVFYNSFSFINMICVFMTIKYIFMRIKCKKIENFIYLLGGCVFGIYIFHPALLRMRSFVLKDLMAIGMNDLFAILLVCFCVLMITFGFILLLRKIPFMNRVL